MKQKTLIFTDLDGTLLDENYRWDKAKDTIEELKKRKIPIIFCSAKTKAEQEKLRKEMGIYDPFIVEDGSAIVIPKECDIGDFKARNVTAELITKYKLVEDNECFIIILGITRSEVLDYITKHKKMIESSGKDANIKGYFNTSVEKISKMTGLSLKDASLAKKREYSETVINCSDDLLESISSSNKIHAHIGGKFIHIYGKNSDKGKAVKILTEIYRKKYGKVYTIGIGNSYTDIPMLLQVDQPAIVRNPDGWIEVNIYNLYKANGVATEGWVEVIDKFALSSSF